MHSRSAGTPLNTQQLRTHPPSLLLSGQEGASTGTVAAGEPGDRSGLVEYLLCLQGEGGDRDRNPCIGGSYSARHHPRLHLGTAPSREAVQGLREEDLHRRSHLKAEEGGATGVLRSRDCSHHQRREEHRVPWGQLQHPRR